MRVLLALGVMLAGGGAIAEGIGLEGPYGNKSGCINKDGQEIYAEHMLLLTNTELVTATSVCTFKDWTIGGGVPLSFGAQCESEGEEGTSPATFVIKQSPKNPKILVISDDTGFTMGEVSLCK